MFPNQIPKLLAVRLFPRLAEDAPFARLPDLAAAAVERGEPAVAPAGGVDAGGEAEVDDFAVALFGVAHGHRLARNMGPLFGRVEEGPPKFVRRLLAHGEVGQIVRVGKNVLVGLIVGETRLDDGPVRLGNVLQLAGEVVRAERGGAAAVHPVVEVGVVVAGAEHHLFVVALDENHAAPLLQLEDPLEDVFRLAAVVDHVAEKDELVGGRRLDRLDHRIERMAAAMNVADGDQSPCGGTHCRAAPGCRSSGKENANGRPAALEYAAGARNAIETL